MAVHYTLTLADYREARIAAGYGVNWLTYGTVAYIGLTVLSIGIAASVPTPTTGSKISMMFLPVAVFALGFVAIMLMQQWQLRNRRDIAPRTRIGLLAFAAISTLVGALLMLRAGGSSLLRDDSPFGVLWWAAPLFFILVIGIRMIASSGGTDVIWKALVDQHRPKELELVPDGIVIRDGVSSYQMRWQGIASSVESENLFVLMVNRYSFLMVPKRAFSTEEDRQRFRDALKAISPPTGGFPVDIPEAKLQN